MLDHRLAPATRELTGAQWHERVAMAAPLLPFADPDWLTLGLRAAPELRFAPLSLEFDVGELLLPLCRSATTAQLGCFGYGTICTGPGWRSTRLPDFRELGEAVHAQAGSRGLSTLLPPTAVLPALDAMVAHWPTVPGPTTYLLDLAGGASRVWTAARGSVRTAVRRAAQLGLRVHPKPGDAAAVRATCRSLVELHRQTMARHDRATPYQEDDLAFLAAEPDTGSVTVVVYDAAGSQAASVMAVSGGVAYHIMQLTSDRGRASNAGVLALWTAISRLAERGVTLLDLGSATEPGQERFKARWGAVPAAARLVRWGI
jgi:Acetyltransferase (GNAT) domain